MNSETQIEGYTSLRTDREGRTHGGVIIFIHEFIPYELLLTFSNGECDLIIISVKVIKRILIIGTVYISLDSSAQEFRDILKNFTSSPQVSDHSKEIIITGDFNLSHCTWTELGTVRNYCS